MFSIGSLLSATTAYVAVLFLIARAAENGQIPKSQAKHPLIYTLSLGVYATSWSFYGSVGFASTDGVAFLTIYLGATIAFAIAPLILHPIHRLTREHKLRSIADLFAFRYGGQTAGVTVTLLMLVGILPYLALQLRAITQSMVVISDQVPSDYVTLIICVMLTGFSILFGTRTTGEQGESHGLIIAIAFESAVKLIALLMAGCVAVWGVFGGLSELQDWTNTHPEAIKQLYTPVSHSSWSSMVLLSFCAAFLLPRQFHMLFHDDTSDRNIAHASWMFPAFLLLLNIPIIPILFAGMDAQLSVPADYTVLGITMNFSAPIVTILVFLGGVSSASAMAIVTTLALSNMMQNYLVLPGRMRFFSKRGDLYEILTISKRVLAGVILFSAYLFTIALENSRALAQLGLISFVAVAQLLPGFLGLLFWPRATGAGFVAGTVSGAIVWFALTVVPVLGAKLPVELATSSTDLWGMATFWTLFVNVLAFILGSMLTRPKLEESAAAQMCADESYYDLSGQVVSGSSPKTFKSVLTPFLGPNAAQKEVDRALQELHIGANEHRPAQLRLLRDRIQRNLSALIGPVLSKLIVDDRIRMEERARLALSDSVQFLEGRLQRSQSELKGVVHELDRLRRYHREILAVLPIGVVAVDAADRISLWNDAMCDMTGLSEQRVAGLSIEAISAPWKQLLLESAEQAEPIRQTVRYTVTPSKTVVLNIAKAKVLEGGADSGYVLLFEDRTEWAHLESEVAHKERLASIGQFAAGVAHEIGNPLTGIASLTQIIRSDSSVPDDIELYDDILLQVERIDKIVKSLLSLSHSGQEVEMALEPVLLHQVIDQAAELSKIGAKDQSIKIKVERDDKIMVMADAIRLTQALINLVQNAMDASSKGQEIALSVQQIGERIRIEVRDQGHGIDTHQRPKIFDPFFTTKPAGKGTGLGLSLVLRTVQMHNGTVKYRPNNPQGSVFSIWLAKYNGK
ncbi:MAG: PAS domain-containing protein [Gammaproteobacteria bacterium]|nr:PAS domain-containing protein [Gammaproteobacteria bacterium]